MSRIFGEIIQNGYVVRDIAAAMQHWIEVLGVGPWFYIEHLSVPDFTYKRLALSGQRVAGACQFRPLQVELIEQRNEAPSLYRDFLNAGHEGLQHVGYGTKNFAADATPPRRWLCYWPCGDRGWTWTLCLSAERKAIRGQSLNSWI